VFDFNIKNIKWFILNNCNVVEDKSPILMRLELEPIVKLLALLNKFAFVPADVNKLPDVIVKFPVEFNVPLSFKF
jgi:hypothetical protein